MQGIPAKLQSGFRLNDFGAGQHQQKLLAAEPAEIAAALQLPRHAADEMHEDVVPDRMAVLVVDVLEPIEVDDRRAGRAALRQHRIEPRP